MKRGVVVRVPAKINLQLAVGPASADGFHEIATVFQAVSLFDDVTVRLGDDGAGVTLTTSGITGGVPIDASNLAIRAANLMLDLYDIPKDIALHIKKEIPVAGGMVALMPQV